MASKAPKRKSSLKKKKSNDEEQIWNEDELIIQDTSDIQKTQSILETCIDFAEKQIMEKHEEMNRISKMYQMLQFIKTSPHFGKEEEAIYRESYNFYIALYKDLVTNFMNAVEKAKQLWTEKQQVLQEKFAEGLMDDGVCRKFSKISDEQEIRITKLDLLRKSFIQNQ